MNYRFQRTRALLVSAMLLGVVAGVLYFKRSSQEASPESTLAGSPAPSSGQVVSAGQPLLLNSGQGVPAIAAVRHVSLAGKLARLSQDAVLRQVEIDQLAAQIPDSQLERTLEEIWDISREGPALELSHLLVRRWAEKMPGLAASWLLHKPDGQQRYELSLAVAVVWGKQQPELAADWVRQWPAEEKEAGLLAVAYEAARTAPREALTLASELGPSEARDGLIAQAAGEWAATDTKTPVTWVAQMPPSPLRDQIIASLSLAISESDPEAAAALAIESLPPGKQQNDAVIGIVQRWAQKDRERTAEWVAAFPEGELRETALANLTSLAKPLNFGQAK